MATIDLFELLSNDERIIVLSCLDDRCIYTWNQSDTLQLWYESHKLPGQGLWVEECILTQSGYGPKTYKEARQVALAWHTGSLDKRSDG
jgi:hypothetical protein